VGIGECMTRLAPKALQAIIEDLAPILRGRDPQDTEVIWERLYGTMMNRGHSRGFFIEALSGIDVALWDLKGNIQGKPVYSLLGGKQGDRLHAYASVSVQLMKIEVTLRLATSGRFREAETERVHHATRPHAQL
jgi:D-galactarolactone cycloisomerase